ncbi:MAG: hypothetical protein IJ783_04310 [Kiritimatiellae bacterium]|nr:hypothetical protein [Kiritimatiellia bacterium]
MNKGIERIHGICFLVFVLLSVASFAMPAHFEIVAENSLGQEALIIDVKENDIKIVKDLAYSEQGQQLVAGDSGSRNRMAFFRCWRLCNATIHRSKCLFSGIS